MSIKVMLVDDHIMVREGVKQLLEFDGEFKVIAEAGSGDECLNKLKKIRPDVLLLDINMPEKNGFDVLTEMREQKMNIKVLLLTIHNSVEYLMKAMDLGADGYVLKESDIVELKKAISIVSEGNRYIQPSLVPAFNSKLISKDQDSLIIDSLTNREIEVLKLVTGGLINKEIGIRLNISERTVKNHISNIFKKLDINDRTQAAIFAIKNNLVTM